MLDMLMGLMSKIHYSLVDFLKIYLHIFGKQICFYCFFLYYFEIAFFFRNLCDVKGDGNLNSEQFALTNYFIKQKQNGFELPIQLAPHMVPPTLRPKPSACFVLKLNVFFNTLF